MSLALIVYLISVIPKIGAACLVILTLVSIFYLISLTSSSVDLDVYGRYGEDDPNVKKAKSLRKLLFNKLWIPIVLLFVAVVTPSKETLYTMVAAYGVEKVVQNPIAQDIASDGVDVLKQLMAKAKRELAEDSKEKDKK